MRMTMQRTLGLCIALCLGLASACVKVDVSVTSPNTVFMPPHVSPEKPPISSDELKKRHAAKKPFCLPTLSRIIDEEKQQTAAWCWAASTRTVMEYYNGNKPTVFQCDIVKNIFRLGKTNCCEVKVTPDFIDAPSRCVQGGWPYWVFGKYKFDYEVVHGALDWDDVKGEICTNGPFISVIEWSGGGKHTIVVTGYSERPSKVVTTYNPSTKDFEDQDFEDFKSGSLKGPHGFHRFSHDRSYVQILPETKDQP